MSDQISVTVIGLNYAPEPLGVAPYTTALCRGLAGRGYRINVVTGMPHYPEWRLPAEYRWTWESTETIDGVPVKRVRHSVPKNTSNVRRVLMEATFGGRAAASRWHSPDVIICTSPALIATAAQCLRRRGSLLRKPALGVWVQDLYTVGMSETQNSASTATGVLGRLESWVLREADGVVVAHDRFRNRLIENMRVDPAKIAVIRNWTHVQSDGTSERSVTRGRFGWADDETVILHAGSMGVKQGLENVVRAAAIADTNDARVRFVLMGDGNQRRALETMAGQTTRLEIRDPIPQSQFMSALKAADILLVNERPGVSEMSIPSKLTSYFLSGTPVLAATGADSNSAREIRASNAGIVVDAGDPNRLLAAAESMGRQPELRENLGANGVAYAAAELSEKAAVDKFDSWIRDMLTARAADRDGNSAEDEGE